MPTSCSSKPRIKRGPPPAKPLKRTTYKRALPELKRDFKDRCAYCMRHLTSRGPRFIEIDHHDPRQKNDYIQRYANLFLADRECNGAKSDIWPSPKEIKEGARFLNCCEEMDYDIQIVEHPTTHELIGLTSAAKFHIEVLDLNAPHLTTERSRRARFRQLLENTPIMLRDGATVPHETVLQLSMLVDEMIPPIMYATKEQIESS